MSVGFDLRFAELVTSARAAATLPALYNVAEKLAEAASSVPEGATSRRQRFAIVGELTIDFIVSAARVALARNGVLADIYAAPFGSFVPELVSQGSRLYAFKPDVVLLAPDFRRFLATDELGANADEIDEALRKRASGLAEHWGRLESTLGCRVIQQLFHAPPERLCGIAERRSPASRDNQIRRLNDRIVELGANSVSFLEIDRFAEQVGAAAMAAQRSYFNGRQPFDPRNLVVYVDYLEAAWRSATARNKKVLVLDLDNTLWGGVIGDDGIEKIQLGVGSPRGEAYQAWQAYIKKLAERGVILAVCSKNDPKIAATGFSHAGSVLQVDDFAAFECSWGDKTAGLRNIARTLNLGLDSFIFADDNPAECELVRQELPAVSVLPLGADPALFVPKFEARCFFAANYYTTEDRRRGEQYRARKQAADAQVEAADLPSYLRGLQMEALVRPFSEDDIERLAQMETKTNQFNLTTRRYTADQLREFMRSDDTIAISFRLRDKFGDHGLVSSLVAQREGDDLEIESWLMSCRVFSRTAEQAIMNYLLDVAAAAGARRIVGVYRATPKNGVVAELYPSLGFKETEDRQGWVLGVEDSNKRMAHMNVTVGEGGEAGPQDISAVSGLVSPLASNETRIVLVYGSCQAHMLSRIMNGLPGVPKEIEFREVTSFELPITGWDEVSDGDMKRVVAMWEQYDDRKEFPHRDSLRARLPAGVPSFVYPPVELLALWPFTGVDARNVPELPRFPYGRFPWSDFIGASLAKLELSDQEIYPRYLELTAQKMPDLDVRLERDVARWRHRDASSDVKLADFVLSSFRAQRLFWTFSHMNGPISVKTALQLYDFSRDKIGGDPTVVHRELEAAMLSFPGDDGEQVPLHPQVAEHFKLTYYDPDATYRFHTAQVTAAEYIRKYVKWEPLW